MPAIFQSISVSLKKKTIIKFIQVNNIKKKNLTVVYWCIRRDDSYHIEVSLKETVPNLASTVSFLRNSV